MLYQFHAKTGQINANLRLTNKRLHIQFISYTFNRKNEPWERSEIFNRDTKWRTARVQGIRFYARLQDTKYVPTHFVEAQNWSEHPLGQIHSSILDSN